MVASLLAGYSALVRIELLVDGLRLPVAQIGGGRLIFDRPVSLPGTTGRIVARIDENEQCWQATWSASDEPRRVVEAELAEIA
jgi:hypothetical protein